MLSALAVGSIFGYPAGMELPRPALVKGERFTLRPVALEDETRVVLFFYSASWCAPCQQTGKALKELYPRLKAQAQGLELITYALDSSPRARADYLRKTAYPWPALSPELLEEKSWLAKIEGGTPQFQAFAVGAETLTAITPPADLKTVMSNLFP